MTRRQFQWRVGLIVLIYAVALGFGFFLRLLDLTDSNVWFATFNDLISLIIALPAAYLAYCIQQRISFLQYLRVTWGSVVAAVNGAILYAQRSAPEAKEYYDVLSALRVAIDDVRGLYRNVGEEEAWGGFYPISPLLGMYRAVAALEDFGELPPGEVVARQALAERLFKEWKSVRGVLLYELDRPEPSVADIRLMIADSVQ